MKVLTSAYCMKPAFIFMAAVVKQLLLLFVVFNVQCIVCVMPTLWTKLDSFLEVPSSDQAALAATLPLSHLVTEVGT